MTATPAEKRWSGKRFTSFVLLFAFLSVLVTGALCYVKPKGMIAHWTGWTLLGLGKEQWEGVHMTMSALLLIASAFHLWFNWNPLVGYFKRAAQALGSGKWELTLSLVVVAVFWIGTLVELAPFSLVDEGHSYFKKEVWGRGAPSAPWDGAEKTALRELALAYGVPYPLLAEKLHAAGLAPRESGESLKSLARRHGLSPAEAIQRVLGRARGMKPAGMLERLGNAARAE